MIHYYLIILIVVSITGCFGLPSVSLQTYPLIDFHETIIKKKLFAKCGETDYVHVTKRKLYEIPSDLIKSDTIKSISLAENEITEIDKNVFKSAPNLECLDFTKNRITLDRLRIQHGGLKTLILDDQRTSAAIDTSSNEIANFGGSEAMLPNLQTLSLRGISDISVDDLAFLANALPKLQNIYLSGGDLRFLVQNNLSAHFPHLKRVYMDHGKLDYLSIDNYEGLEELYLDNNLFRYFFVSSDFRSLKTLSLANCSLSDPTQLKSPYLTSLDLSGNKFSNLNTELFQDMTNLENLNLGYNQFREVPYLVYLDRLQQMSLNYNHITEITNMNLPKSLKVLSLKGNRLSFIDKTAFSNLYQLQALDLSENEIQSLPNGWDKSLEQLGHLNLRFNKFINIQSMMINFLPKLEELYVKGNNFQSIDSDSLQKLPNNCTVYTF